MGKRQLSLALIIIGSIFFNHVHLEMEEPKRVRLPQQLLTHQNNTFALIHGRKYVRRSIFPFAVNSERGICEPIRTGVLLVRMNQ